MAVAVGGALGTALRFWVDLLVPHAGNEFPVSTLVVNCVGACILGYVVARFWSGAPRWLRAGLGTGLLGSFTTFSAIVVSLITLGYSGNWAIAFGYLSATLVLGCAGALLGLRLGRNPASTAMAGSAPATDTDTDTSTE